MSLPVEEFATQSCLESVLVGAGVDEFPIVHCILCLVDLSV